MRNKALYIVCLIVALIVVSIISFQLGVKSVPSFESNTFYATIDSVSERSILVTGISINDINYRGQFDILITDATVLEWRKTNITISDLTVGNTVSITYTGTIRETSPAQIGNVLKVQLLDD